MVLASAATASAALVTDPDDSPGGLDVSAVRQGYHEIIGTGQRLIRHRIETLEGWDIATFLEGNTYAEIDFDLDGGGLDRRLTIDASDGSMYAVMYGSKPHLLLGYARVWKPDPKRVVVEFPRRLFDAQSDGYRWRVRTVFHDDSYPDCATVDDMVFLCADHAPDTGWIKSH